MGEYTKFLSQQQNWQNGHKASEDKKLELRLGPPGELHGFSNNMTGKRALHDQTNWVSSSHEKQCKRLSWASSPPPKGSCRCCSYVQCSTVAELQCQDMSKACCGQSHSRASFAARDGTSGPPQRVAGSQVVGWPPVRSSRKNLAISNSKLASDLSNKSEAEGVTVKPETLTKDLFVKINMEGIPIGRKINLNAYDSYDKLSIGIDELFRGLLSAQRDNCGAVASNVNKIGEAKGVENEEYTLVYEDCEGDRILVGDVPWQMFVSTAKRLRVLKSSQVSNPRRESTCLS